MDEYCKKCGKELTHDEIALYRKIYNRGAKDFLCISCSSQYLEVSEELLLTKMQEFKDMGCTLFLQQQHFRRSSYKEETLDGYGFQDLVKFDTDKYQIELDAKNAVAAK